MTCKLIKCSTLKEKKRKRKLKLNKGNTLEPVKWLFRLATKPEDLNSVPIIHMVGWRQANDIPLVCIGIVKHFRFLSHIHITSLLIRTQIIIIQMLQDF